MAKRKLIALLMMFTFASLLLMNFGEQVGGYMSFDEAEHRGMSAHVVGDWASDHPMQYDRENDRFVFHMTDEKGNLRRVTYHGHKPENFEQAEQLVIEGHPDGDEFVAKHILVKCPSKYNDQEPA